MAVFPESMSRIDPSNPQVAIMIMENYIRYMCERLEFSASNTAKNVSAAGVSSSDMYLLVKEQADKVSALQSKVNLLEGKTNEMASQISELSDELQECEDKIAQLETRIGELEQKEV